MPKRKNLDLAAEMGEDVDVTEQEAIEANEIVQAVEPAAPAAAPMAPITLTFEQLQQLLGAQRPMQGTEELIKSFTQGIERAREPRPENKFSPEISDLNPLGDRDYPRPGLRWKVSLGLQDQKSGVITSTFQFDERDLTCYEQLALNILEPVVKVIKRLDGADMPVQVVPRRHAVTDVIEKLIIVVPQYVTAKGSDVKNMLPNVVNIAAQLTGHDMSKLSHEDLAYLMAEHRKKNYIAEVPKVVAA